MTSQSVKLKKGKGRFARFSKYFAANWQIYLMILPALAFYTLFCYKPMYGAIIAFKDYSPRVGIWGSEWVGFKHFVDFFTGPYFSRTLFNTLWISVCTLLVSFPAPIILAVMINELRSKAYSRVVQTASYLPHFISLVVICSLIKEFTAQGGIITELLTHIGFPDTSMLNEPKYFVPIYVISETWQVIGWDSIIYLAALAGIDPQLYEVARIDGAGKWKQMWNVTLPGIQPTVIIMLILRLGNILNVGFEKIILLYNPLIYKSSDVISTYVYRLGFESQDWSYSTAVGLFNSVVNFIVIILANFISRKFSETSLW